MQKEYAGKILRIGAALSLILFPMIFMVSFALHFKSVEDFFRFELRYVADSARDMMNTLAGPDRFRLYELPHLIAFASVPFVIVSALVLGYFLFKTKPLYSLIGAGLSVIGAVFLAGVFASWLSFAAVANVPSGTVDQAVAVLEQLTKMQGSLLLITMLSGLSLVGMLVLSIGLFRSALVPRWSAVSLFAGNLLIMLFMDLDNWMLIGSIFILVGMTPISLKILNVEERSS